jgi:hypothetical protein
VIRTPAIFGLSLARQSKRRATVAMTYVALLVVTVATGVASCPDKLRTCHHQLGKTAAAAHDDAYSWWIFSGDEAVGVVVPERGKPSWGQGEDEARSWIDALGGFGKIVGRCGHNVGQELLRIAVVEGKPRALNLNLDAMTFEKRVIGGVEAEAIFEELVSRDGFGSSRSHRC